jgi:hypothetical protein
MPFQNAPAIIACGAKICRDELIVVRHNKKNSLDDKKILINFPPVQLQTLASFSCFTGYFSYS